MERLLGELNAVPGVVGSMVCDADGALLAQAFPPTFDPSALKSAAAVLADRTTALGAAVGALGMIDLRYHRARIVVRVADRIRLLFLCAPAVNLQLLTLSSSGAIRRLELLAASPAPPRASGLLYEAVQKVNALIERSGKDRLKLRGQIALKAGFALDLVDPEAPDDPGRLEKLRSAARAVLGQSV